MCETRLVPPGHLDTEHTYTTHRVCAYTNIHIQPVPKMSKRKAVWKSVRYVQVCAGLCGPCRSVRTRTDLCDVWSVVCCHTMKDGENKM